MHFFNSLSGDLGTGRGSAAPTSFTARSSGVLRGCLLLVCLLGAGADALAGSVLSAGFLHVCGVRTDQSLVCWGSNDEGQTSSPTGQFQEVSAGAYFNCALNLSGGVQCWGRDTDGETSPPSGTYVEIATGNNHACARRADNNEVICWGANESSQSAYLPGPFVQLALGNAHSCGLRSNGSVECWGSNSHGQSGPSMDNAYRSIAAGFDTTCGVNTSGQANCWGRTPGTFGFMDQIDFALQGQTQAGAPSITCGVRTDGTLSCPTLTPPTGVFTYVTTGGHDPIVCVNRGVGGNCLKRQYQFRPFACGVRENGVVACWGDNASGRAAPPVGEIMPPSAGPRECIPFSLDVDYDGEVTGLTDGLMILRYLMGHRGDDLVRGINGGARDAEAIGNCIEGMKPNH